ncbi:MAG: GGDEF domain-containing protein [Helicobacteraceae bacterium]|nr:GGDEF domain-containing protein [Candidatus Sulfurimonas ponti]MBL6972752.1 GGDEF domain-containing protein [Sulfurimonas sp.]
MTSNKNLILSFLSILLLTTILGVTSIYKMLDLSKITEDMFEHPFIVSNAIAHIEIESVHIQHKMHIITSLEDVKEIYNLSMAIAVHHNNAIDLYKLIYERYLGNIQDIDNSYNAFLQWKKYRDHIIDMLLDGSNGQISVYKEKESNYANTLNTKIDTLRVFANNKAIVYNDNAKNSKKNSIIIVSILFILIGLISSIIALVVLRSSARYTENIDRHFHLIEQNINLAKLDTDFNIAEVTESLARLFSLEKGDLINHESNLLLGSDEKQIKEMKTALRSGKSWNGEIHIENVAWIYADIKNILDSTYKIIGYDMIISDITSKKQLEIVSVTDGMTGLYNRREFDKNFNQRLSLAKRESNTLVFMMLDIDHFKAYNDHYGHQDGDKALKAVASALKATFNRPDDAVYRLGGEEFGVLFTANNEQGVEEISQRVLDNIEALNIKHEYSSVCDHITISIGAGIIDSSNTQSADKIYVEVDSALYEAKDNGRNRYEILTI